MGQSWVFCTGKAIISGNHMYNTDLLQSMNKAKVQFIGSAKWL